MRLAPIFLSLGLVTAIAWVGCGGDENAAPGPQDAGAPIEDTGAVFGEAATPPPPSTGPYIRQPNDRVTAMTPLDRGGYLLAGHFETLDALPHQGILTLDARDAGTDGGMVPSAPFKIDATGTTVMYWQSVWPELDAQGGLTGKIYAVGHHTGGDERSFRRFNADGTVDDTFQFTMPCEHGQPFSSLRERAADGKWTGNTILAFACGTPQSPYSMLVRYDANGKHDAAFAPEATKFKHLVDDIRQEKVAGQYTARLIVRGTTCDLATDLQGARLNADGSCDPTFQPAGTIQWPDEASDQLYHCEKKTGTTTCQALTSTGALDAASSFVASPPMRIFARRWPSAMPRVTRRALGWWGAPGRPTDPTLEETLLVRIRADHTVDPAFNAAGVRFRSTKTGTAWLWNIVQEVGPDGALTGAYLAGANTDRWGDKPTTVGVVRIKADGTLDEQFLAGMPGMGCEQPIDVVQELDGARKPSGRLFLVSYPSAFATKHDFVSFAKIQASGAIDTSFKGQLFRARFNQVEPWRLLELHDREGKPNGSYIAAGAFVGYGSLGDLAGIVRILPDGSPDPSFVMPKLVLEAGDAGGLVNDVVDDVMEELDSDGLPTGRILVASYTVRGVVRLLPDGTPDPSFTAPAMTLYGASLLRRELAVNGKPTGRLLMGDTVGGALTRLESNGTKDPTFNAGGIGFDLPPSDVVAERGTDGLPTGKWLVAGIFLHYNGNAVPRGLVRLLADGTLDATFQNAVAQPSGQIEQLLGPDGKPTGKLLRTGSASLDRLEANGALDTSFVSGLGTGGYHPFKSLMQERNASGLPTGRVFVISEFDILAGGAIKPFMAVFGGTTTELAPELH